MRNTERLTVMDMDRSWSPNMTKFLKKNRHFQEIFLDPKDRIWYIGFTDIGGKHHGGVKFLEVLCRGNKVTKHAFTNEKNDRLVDRTDQFVRCVNHFGKWMFRKWYWEKVMRTNDI